MKEPHREGPASHPDPESCVDGREAVGEASTGAHAGQVSSREITIRECRHRPHRRKATPMRPFSEVAPDSPRSKTLRMHASTLCGNREIPCLPVGEGITGRVGKSKDAHR